MFTWTEVGVIIAAVCCVRELGIRFVKHWRRYRVRRELRLVVSK